MAKKKKKKSGFNKIKSLLSKLLLLGLVFGGYYIYQNPDLIPKIESTGQVKGENSGSQLNLESYIGEEKAAEVLGKATSLIEDGLENISIPKQLSGTDDQIVIEDAVDQFTQKIKDLPEQQVDRIKVEFCKDVLDSVENASVVVEE